LACRGERRSPGQGRPQDAPTIETIVPLIFYEIIKFDGIVKSRNSIEFVIPANPGSGPGQAPESSNFRMFWTPAFAGVTIQEIFYEIIKFRTNFFRNKN
jgi:hypothetical protein